MIITEPTQIYRYLRSRNRLSVSIKLRHQPLTPSKAGTSCQFESNPFLFSYQPIFLHRNLTYMKDRMSRKHKTRPSFRLDALLNDVTDRNSLEEEKNGAPNNYMTLLFLGFYNKSMVEEQFVEVEIIVSKIAQMKRKDSFKSKQERVSVHNGFWNNF